MRWRVKAVNQFTTSIASTSSIDATSETGSFVLDTNTVNGFTLETGTYLTWVCVDFNKYSKEIFRIYRVDGNTVYFDQRGTPTGKFQHNSGAKVQINEIAEFINYLSANVDDFGFVEKGTTAGTVNVRGGVYLWNATQYARDDVVLTCTLADGYVYFNPSTSVIAYGASVPSGSYSLARITCSAGVVTNILDQRAFIFGSSSGWPLEGHIIQDSTTTYPYRSKLKVIGSTVTVSDDFSNDTTVIDVSAPQQKFYCGTVDVSSGVTTLTVTGCPFKPKMIRVQVMIGSRWIVWGSSTDGKAGQCTYWMRNDSTFATSTGVRTSEILYAYDTTTAPVTNVSAVLTSMTSDGFTLTFSNNSHGAFIDYNLFG